MKQQVCFTVFFLCATSVALACDGEWHREGELSQWTGISFSESNYPEIMPEENRGRKPRKRKRKREKSRQPKRETIVIEDIPEG